MATYIVDTNVFITAQGDAGHLSAACQQIALNFVRELSSQHNLAVDDAYKIINEYRHNIPRLSFIDTLLNRIFKAKRVSFAEISLDMHGDAILPAPCQIKDRSDRKFVAVALTHPAQPPICNASDTDWLENENVLNTCNVQIIHLCEREIRQQFAEKAKKRSLS